MKILIVVDMQKGFIKENNKFLIDKINNLIATSKYDKIIFTKFKNDKNSLYEIKLKWTRLQSEDEQQIVINIPKNAIIYEKYGYGLGNDALQDISQLRSSTFDICGVQTDACVYAIAFQLFDRGIYPNELINYTMTIDKNKQNNAKNILIHQFGKVDEKE